MCLQLLMPAIMWTIEQGTKLFVIVLTEVLILATNARGFPSAADVDMGKMKLDGGEETQLQNPLSDGTASYPEAGDDTKFGSTDVGIGNRWDLDSPADTEAGREIPADDDEKGLAATATRGENSGVPQGAEALALRQVNSRGGVKSSPAGDRQTTPKLNSEVSTRTAIWGTLQPYLSPDYYGKVTFSTRTLQIHTTPFTTTLREQSHSLTRLNEPVSAFSTSPLKIISKHPTSEVTTAANSVGRENEAVVNSVKPSEAASTRDVKSLENTKQNEAGFLLLGPDEDGQLRRTVPAYVARESNHPTPLSHDLTFLNRSNVTVSPLDGNRVNYQNDTRGFNTTLVQTSEFEEQLVTGDYSVTEQNKIYSNNTAKSKYKPTTEGLSQSTSSIETVAHRVDRLTTSLSGLLVPLESSSQTNTTLSPLSTGAWNASHKTHPDSTSAHPDQVGKEVEWIEKVDGQGLAHNLSDTGKVGEKKVVTVLGQVWVNSTHNDTTLSISLANSTDQLFLLTNTSQLPSKHSKQDKQSLSFEGGGYNNSDISYTTVETSNSTKTTEVFSTTETMGKTSMPLDTTIKCDGLLCLDLLGETAYNLSGVNVTDYDVIGATEGDDVITRIWEVLLLLVIVVAGITGNVLVVIAVVIEKKLQNVTNYFLVSLAVADCLVSLIVMPCSIVHELMGYWPFGLIVCDIWQVCDVMMCTSSIMHMCSISLDRYIAIRRPLLVRNKSRTIVGIKIATVWFISLAIASPIILLSVLDPENVLHNNTCAIFNQYFLIYGSLAAFFIPLLIMLIAYSLTIHILNKQARKCSENAKKGAPVIRRSLSRRRRSRDLNRLHRKPSQGLANIHTANGLNFARKLQTQLTQLDRSKSLPSEREPLHTKDKRKSNESSSPSPSPQVNRIQRQFSRLSSQNSDLDSSTAPSPAVNSRVTHRAGSQEDMEREGSESPRAQGGSPRLQALVKKHSAAIKVASVLMQKTSDTKNKREMNTVKTERKAVKVLGTMFFIFVLCWGPFFSLNFAMGVCDTCDIDVILFKVFLWLGYVSSTLNPLIYTIFNKTFKRTFIKILKCRQCKLRERKIHKSVTFTTSNGNSIKVKYENTGTLSSAKATTAAGHSGHKLRHNESMV